MAAQVVKGLGKALGATLFLFAAWPLAEGCGRSSIDDYATDGGPIGDAQPDVVGSCNAANCPSGCCDTLGKCVGGTDFQACGGRGQACEDCKADNFDHCDPALHACATPTAQCDAVSCATGCCTVQNGQPVCISGVSSVACGTGGVACTDCTQTGKLCDAQTHACQATQCGPNNCKGCCSGGVCVGGGDNAACGLGGQACTSCASNTTCNPGTGTCDSTPPSCSPQTCPNGCCSNGTCLAGVADTQCGFAGSTCQDCRSQSQVCAGGKCTPPQPTCNAQNCVGCCLGNVCYAGFVDNRCGSAGAACADCTASKSTCDGSSNPRVCTNQPSSCPAAYGSCGNAQTPALAVNKGVCSNTDLQDAKNACKSGWNTVACQAYFTTISSINPSCSKCLAPFDYDLTAGTGIYNCVAAFVSPQCNQATGCADDCVGASCGKCPSNNKASCETQVRGFGGQCTKYFQQTGCVIQALFNGPAQFCSPQQYGGNYGNWLNGVGAHYCGP